MKMNLILILMFGLLLLSPLIPPARAAAWGGDPAEILYAAITSPYPGYQLNARDHINNGNLYKAECEKYSSLYNERLRAYVRGEAALQNAPVDMDKLSNPTAQQRNYIMSTGFHNQDTIAAGYYEKTLYACDLAQKHYNKAFQLTKNDNYYQQAEIFEEGSGLYDALGMRSEAEQTRDAAAAAHAQAAASSLFLPISPFVAMAGLVGAFLVIKGRREMG